MIKRCLNIFFVVSFIAFASGGLISCSEEGAVLINGLPLTRIRNSYIYCREIIGYLCNSIYEGNLAHVKEVMTHLPEWIHEKFQCTRDDCDGPHSLFLTGTPLNIASASPKASEVANYLIAHGACPDQRQGGILHQVLRHLCDQKEQDWFDEHCIELTQFLLSQSWIDLNAYSERDGRTYPLHLAVEADVIDIVQTMLAAGARVDSKNHSDRTALHYACSDKGAQLLLDYGAELEAVDAGGRTPLHCAAEAGYISTIQCLLGHHADLHAQDSQLDTPLGLVLRKLAVLNQFASEKDKGKYMGIAKLLINSGMMLGQRTENDLKQLQAPYRKWIQEKIHCLLSNDLNGTYVKSLPMDLQRLLCAFLVSQTSLKRKREYYASERHTHKKSKNHNVR